MILYYIHRIVLYIYLGPYSGRNPNLIAFTSGVLTNPNCEFEANYIAIHTLGAWKKSFKEKLPVSHSELEAPLKPSCFDEANKMVLSCAEAKDEIDHEAEHIGHGEYCPRRSLEIALSDWLPNFLNSQIPLESQLSLEDLKLLSDLYYLPYEYGDVYIRKFSLPIVLMINVVKVPKLLN